MATQQRFCGTCGAAVPPGAPFCGRCGTPQVAPAYATPPQYAYAQAPARPATGLRGVSGSQVAVAAALLIVLSVVTVTVSAFAVGRVIGSHSTCTSNCGAKIVTPLPAPAKYKSSALGFEVDYDPNWMVRNQDPSSVTLATKLGLLQVSGTHPGLPPDRVLQSAVSALQSNAAYQAVVQVTALKGAHIGDQDGVGAVYSANLIASNGTATKIRFFIVTAIRGGVTMEVFGVNPADPKNYPNGIPEAQEFDSVLQEFQWGPTPS
jgi:hypothetical protein